jgi:hypothetical protein
VADAPGTYGGWRDDADDGWGPSTSVRSAGGNSSSGLGRSRGRNHEPGLLADSRRGERADSAAAPTTRAGSHSGSAGAAHAERRPAVATSADEQPQFTPHAHERGLPGWGALLVLVGIAAVGGLIDMLRGTHVRGGFNIAIVVAAFVGILIVRRSSLFTVVVAPPIVYTAASLGTVYFRSGGLKDKKVLLDSAANWLVYGFPAIAAASAAVLIIAGVRLIVRR